MTGNDLKALAAAALGFGWGIYWFFKGFGIYREFRVLKDTPEIPIRSISMGLVHIHGKAQGQETVNSPISDTPCLYYHVSVEKWTHGSRGGGSWTAYRTDSKGVKFSLEDASGRTTVDPNGCEVKLASTSITETKRTHAPALGAGGAGLDPRLSLALYQVSDNHLNAYAARLGEHGHSMLGAVETLALQSEGGYAAGLAESGSLPPAYRFTEYCIRDGDSLDVTGTCTENPQAKDIQDRNMIVKGQNEPTFLITSQSEEGIEAALRRGAMVRIYGGAALALFCVGYILFKFRLL
ncbi:MAG: hypothetical protein DMG21_06130 [Acidobacteria bacterium]|nr:MAG: hypothetical protein DMG21_06130 [Acidobacteriota bacterium]